MLFPVSGVEVNPFVPPLIALVVSTFTSMGGVSGAFLLLPYQVSFLGFSSPAAPLNQSVANLRPFRERLGEAVSGQGSIPPGIQQC